MTVAEKLVRAKDDIDAVFEAGKQAEYDRFWDEYQLNGTPHSYAMAFGGRGWTDEVYNPKYDIVLVSTANQMFNSSYVTDTKVSIDISEPSVQLSHVFSYSKLVTIRKLIVGENNSLLNAFTGCTKLQNIVFEGVIGKNLDIHWSTLLTVDSLESIVTHLSDTATGYTCTLPTTAESTYNAVHGDGAWSALVATKTNWTFAYA